MTDTAQEQEQVEDWTDEELATTLEHSATLLNAGIDTLAENEHLVGRYMEAARRLRARQREDGEGEQTDLLGLVLTNAASAARCADDRDVVRIYDLVSQILSEPPAEREPDHD